MSTIPYPPHLWILLRRVCWSFGNLSHRMLDFLLINSLASIIIAGIVCAAPAYALPYRMEQALAQQQEQEVQVALDREGKVMLLTGETTRMYGLFTDYPNVADVRLFMLHDSSFVLEITQVLNDIAQRTRIPMTIWQVMELRERVTTALSMRQDDAELRLNDWEKLSYVLAGGTTGLYYGILTDAITSGRSSSFNTATLVMPLVFGGATFVAVQQPWFNLVSGGMIFHGLYLGALHGAGLFALVADQATNNPEVLITSMVTTGAAEAVAGTLLAKDLQWNFGQSSVVTALGGSGLFTGIVIASLTNSFGQTGLDAPRAIGASVLLSSAAGYYAGHLLTANTSSWANGDGIVFSSPAGLSALLPISILISAGSFIDDINPVLLWSLVSHIGGYAIGGLMVANKDFTLNQGRAISQAVGLGMLPGLVVGSALRDGFRSMPLLSVIGGAVGLGIGYALEAGQAEGNARNNETQRAMRAHNFSLDANLPSGYQPSWLEERWNEFATSTFMRNTDVQFSPLGLMGIAMPQALPVGLSLPILSLRHTFDAPPRPSIHNAQRGEAE